MDPSGRGCRDSGNHRPCTGEKIVASVSPSEHTALHMVNLFFLKEQLGEIVHVELPEVGVEVGEGGKN